MLQSFEIGRTYTHIFMEVKKMEKIRNFEDVMNELNKSENYYRCRIEAWKKVSRLSKKDGSDFATLSKNFEGAKICMPYYLNSVSDRQIEICFTDENGRFATDYFKIWRKAKDGQELTGRNTYKPWSETWYEMNTEEIFEEINATIEKYQTWLDSIIEQKKVAKKTFSKLEKMVKEAKTLVDDVNDKEGSSTLHFALRSYVENFYWAI